jgi:hypothetical protein
MDVSGHVLVSRYIHIIDMFHGTEGVFDLEVVRQDIYILRSHQKICKGSHKK